MKCALFVPLAALNGFAKSNCFKLVLFQKLFQLGFPKAPKTSSEGSRKFGVFSQFNNHIFAFCVWNNSTKAAQYITIIEVLQTYKPQYA